MKARPSRVLARLVGLCLAALICSACSSSQPAPAQPARVSFTDGCATFPHELLERFVWSSDGSHLAIVSSVDVAGGNADQISVLDWSTLNRTILYRGPINYSGTASLQETTIDPSGSTAYFWANMDGSFGIWSVGPAGVPKLLAHTDSIPSQLQWSPDGIFRVSFDLNAGVDTFSLTSWTGATRVVRQDHDVVSPWITSDGWTIDMPTGPQNLYRVVHGDVDVTAAASVFGQLLGMTKDRSSIVYRPPDQDGADGYLRLTLLPIDGGPETHVDVPISIGRAAGFFSLSDTGVLAYTDSDSETSELCTSKVPSD